MFALNLGVLESLLTGGSLSLHSLVMGDLADYMEQVTWHSCFSRIPVTLRLKNYGALVWVHGEVEACVDGDLIRGLRIKTKDSTEFSLTNLPLPWDGHATAHTGLGGQTLILAKDQQPLFATPDVPFPLQAEIRGSR